MDIVINTKKSFLTVTSERLQDFNQKINFGEWYDLFDKKGNPYIWIKINKINDGEEYEINLEGFEEDDPDAPEDYYIYDLLFCYDAEIIR
jgi:hypothetical protein